MSEHPAPRDVTKAFQGWQFLRDRLHQAHGSLDLTAERADESCWDEGWVVADTFWAPTLLGAVHAALLTFYFFGDDDTEVDVEFPDSDDGHPVGYLSGWSVDKEEIPGAVFRWDMTRAEVDAAWRTYLDGFRYVPSARLTFHVSDPPDDADLVSASRKLIEESGDDYAA